MYHLFTPVGDFNLTVITRHGINRNDTGPLMRSSFEETVNILHDAAIYVEADHLKGAIENIMFGQLVPIGTGDCALYLNDDMLQLAIKLQLPSYMKGLGFCMTPSRSPISGTPYYEVLMSTCLAHIFDLHQLHMLNFLMLVECFSHPVCHQVVVHLQVTARYPQDTV